MSYLAKDDRISGPYASKSQLFRVQVRGAMVSATTDHSYQILLLGESMSGNAPSGECLLRNLLHFHLDAKL